MRNYHENGSGQLSTDAQPLGFMGWFTTGLLVLLTLALFALGQHADDVDEQKLRKLAEAEKAQRMLPLKVRDAYERGLADAMEALKDTPDGVRLAQACMANGLRPVNGSQR